MEIKELNKWLREGKQSKTTTVIRKIIEKFQGDDLQKIIKILDWIEGNIKQERDYNRIIKIFASRNIDKVIKDKFSTGCHDDALILVTFLRALNIPSKYIVGIDKLTPKHKGHCVVEAYIKNKWILIEPTSKIIYLEPLRSDFYHNNYIISKELDSWGNKIKTFNDWKKISQKVINNINKIRN